ncbi:MAG TPA: DegT/DnrJ/EryC1/StrS family aminotransferase [Candidatus Aminicenantes bacterium]|nr:DegT/DnrJ/EryC1/StrS family aminotransferase [Candidatus Aminicenantes bacterium]
MKVPLLDLKAQYASIKEEIRTAVDDVFDSQYFILGPKVKELEQEIARYSEISYALGVSSGTDALLISLMALGIEPGDEVITTPFTFFSTAGVISRLNATPKFVDIDPDTFNMDPEKLESAITRRTKAVIPVHLFGQCADMDPILEVSSKYGLPVIEDAAQSIGAQYKHKKAGSMAEFGVFSFFPSKNLGGAGDGGMVITRESALYDKLQLLRVHGARSKYYHKIVGGNFRLDSLQAAVLLVKLKYLDSWSEKRRKNAALYNRLFAQSGLIERGIIKTPVEAYKDSGDRNHHIYNQYTLRTRSRDKLQEYLKEQGVSTAIYYPLPLHLQECFKDLGYLKGDFPEAEKASGSVISLPVYPELTDEQQEYIVEKISGFFK